MGSGVTLKWDHRAIKKLTEEVSRKAMGAARFAATAVRCPVHGERVRSVERNPRTGDFTIEACCEVAVKAAEQAISRTLR